MGQKFLSDEELDEDIGDDSIYSENVRDRLLEVVVFSPEEAVFIEGYVVAYV